MQLFARKIENLTDARYFAAWNVDFMSFEVPAIGQHTPISHADITEIKNWLSGPNYVGEYSMNFSWDQIVELNQQLGLDYICVDQFYPFEQIDQPLSHPLFIQCQVDEKDSLNSLLNQISPFTFPYHLILHTTKSEWNTFLDILNVLHSTNNLKNIWLDFPVSPEVATNFDPSNEELGICFRGSMEEKVGVKSFDDLDEVFDILESKGIAGF